MDSSDQPPSSPKTLLRTTSIPIAQISPENEHLAECSIHAAVTLVWPYSSSTKSLSLLLAEPDFRLRRSNGQVKVVFHGIVAENVAKSQVRIGDKVYLSLDGSRLVDNDTTTQTPGRFVGWDLHFDGCLLLEVLRSSQHLSVIKVDRPSSPLPSAENDILPPSPPNASHTRPEGSSTVSGLGSWGSPFFQRSRASLGGVADSALDPFAEEDGFVPGRGRKRPRFSMRSSEWRVIDEPESPGDKEDVMDWTHIFDEAESPEPDVREEELAPDNEAPTDSSTIPGPTPDKEDLSGPKEPETAPEATDNALPDAQAHFGIERAAKPNTKAFDSHEFRVPNLLQQQLRAQSGLDTSHLPTDTPRIYPVPSPGLPIPSPLVTTPNNQQSYFTSAPTSQSRPITAEVLAATNSLQEGPVSHVEEVSETQVAMDADTSPTVDQQDLSVARDNSANHEFTFQSQASSATVESGTAETSFATNAEPEGKTEAAIETSENVVISNAAKADVRGDDRISDGVEHLDYEEIASQAEAQNIYSDYSESEDVDRPSVDEEDLQQEDEEDEESEEDEEEEREEDDEVEEKREVDHAQRRALDEQPTARESHHISEEELDIEELERRRTMSEDPNEPQTEGQEDNGYYVEDEGEEEEDVDEEMDDEEDEDGYDSEGHYHGEGDYVDSESDSNEDYERHEHQASKNTQPEVIVLDSDSEDESGPTTQVQQSEGVKQETVDSEEEASSEEEEEEEEEEASDDASVDLHAEIRPGIEGERPEGEWVEEEGSGDEEEDGAGDGEESEEADEERVGDEEMGGEEIGEDEEVEEDEEMEDRPIEVVQIDGQQERANSAEIEAIEAQPLQGDLDGQDSTQSFQTQDEHALTASRSVEHDRLSPDANEQAIPDDNSQMQGAAEELSDYPDQDYPDHDHHEDNISQPFLQDDVILVPSFQNRDVAIGPSLYQSEEGQTTQLEDHEEEETIHQPELEADQSEHPQATERVDYALMLDGAALSHPGDTASISKPSSFSLHDRQLAIPDASQEPRLNNQAEMDHSIVEPHHTPQQTQETHTISHSQSLGRISPKAAVAETPAGEDDSVLPTREPGAESPSIDATEERDPLATQANLDAFLQNAARDHSPNVNHIPDLAAPDRHYPGLRSKYSYFAPLATLIDHFNASIDTISIVCDVTSIVQSASGKKDYILTAHLTDPSMAGTTLPVQISRPYKSVLPFMTEGDAILLRDFKVKSSNHTMMLASAESSAWAVFSTNEPQINGPPVEYGTEELAYTSHLQQWYLDTGAAMIADHQLQASIEKASREVTPMSSADPSDIESWRDIRGDSSLSARSSRRRKSHRRVTIHELRNGRMYTEVGSPSDKESIHELRDGTAYAHLR